MCFEPVEIGTVRDPILASWARSRDWKVVPEHFELPYHDEPERAASLTHGAAGVVAESAGELAGQPVSLILTDAEGVVLDRRTGDRRLERQLDRVSLAPGFSYAEQFAGTNGIGTALEGRGPAHVFGHEHYVEHLEELACAGAPIRHPTTGKVLGVVDLTCWRQDAGPTMLAAVATIARRIEEALLEYSGRRELALLHDYLATCQRNRGPVLAISNDLVMLNDSARTLIDSRDQAQLLALATEALAGGKPRQLATLLPSGASARLHCKPSWTDQPVVGGVVQVQMLAAVPTQRTTPPPAQTAGPRRGTVGCVGSGALWAKCCQEVEAQFRTREWLLLEGEPGVGKLTVAKATHLAHTPGAHLRVFDAADAIGPDRGAYWLDTVRDELVGGQGTVILRHVDRLTEELQDALADLIGLIAAIAPEAGGNRPWLVATRVGSGPVPGALARLVDRFPHSVEVPPLRYHVEDVRELVPFLISRLTRGAALHCSPEAMRVFLRNRWPGNVEQLYQVIRKIVVHRRTGTIVLPDLPAEVQATSRRVLTPLESIECDAIVACLHSVDGNRAEAARHLGMSRATIYRKIRDFGIVVPPSKSS